MATSRSSNSYTAHTDTPMAMKVRTQLMKAFEEEAVRLMQQRLAERIQLECSDAVCGWTRSKLMKYVVDGYEDGVDLDITHEDDIFRFLRLGLLGREYWSSEFVEVITRILHNRNASAHRRLNFIERHVIRPRA